MGKQVRSELARSSPFSTRRYANAERSVGAASRRERKALASDFNNFETINANQAWSLFFTAGQDDKGLGQEIEFGRFFTNLLIAVGVTGILWAIYFSQLG
ncbi:hypothetical protein [Nostoc sp.]|uniref:hypothetical protein n=1 Tax=Nostoc sp. TaxID=1180 RepID=UPI002FF988F6